MPIFKDVPAQVTGHVPVKLWMDAIEQQAEQVGVDDLLHSYTGAMLAIDD